MLSPCCTKAVISTMLRRRKVGGEVIRMQVQRCTGCKVVVARQREIVDEEPDLVQLFTSNAAPPRVALRNGK